MSSLSEIRYRSGSGRGEGLHGPLDPDTLLAAGILRNTNNPEQCYKRAKSLVYYGRYNEARNLLFPHMSHLEGGLRPLVTELLAICATQGAGGEWQQLLRNAFELYETTRDLSGMARCQYALGEMYMRAGRFSDTDRVLSEARRLFNEAGDQMRVTMTDALLARSRIKAGHFVEALDRLDTIVRDLQIHERPEVDAQVHLDRARIFATFGDATASAKELIAAERFLGVSGSVRDRLMMRLTRAETLVLLGQPQRAASGLLRLLGEVSKREEMSLRAWSYFLLGHALLDDNAPAARQYLVRSRHLFESLNFDYYMVACDIALVHVEQSLGLHPLGRLQTVAERNFSEWPLMEAHFRLVRAEVDGEGDLDSAKEDIDWAITFAKSTNNMHLLGQSQTVSQRMFVKPSILLERRPSAPVVQQGTGNVPEPVPYETSTQERSPVVSISRLLQFSKLERSKPTAKPASEITAVSSPWRWSTSQARKNGLS